MDVILLERIVRLGQIGDIVTVKNGFARNFLLPKGKALRANEINRKYFESLRSQLEARNLELKTEAKKIAKQLEGKSFIIIRSAAETGQLYGSVSTRNIAELVTEEGFSISRTQVALHLPIKILGLHNIQIILHPEVRVEIIINVARSVEEAKRQEKGMNTVAVEENFESETSFQDLKVEPTEDDINDFSKTDIPYIDDSKHNIKV